MDAPQNVPLGIEGYSFVLCDVNGPGFPIRHVSPAFEELFGYSETECQGKKCGALVGTEAVLEHGLKDAASVSGLAVEEAEAGLRVIRGRATAEMRAMVASPSQRGGHAVVLNRKKSGELMVCELDMRILQHPTLGWSYCVGLQNDISSEVTPGHLIRAASEGEEPLGELVDARKQSAKGSQARDLMGKEASVKHLNETAAKMWQALVKATMISGGDKVKKSATPSLASRSTTASIAASCRSIASARSCASGSPTNVAATFAGQALGVKAGSGTAPASVLPAIQRAAAPAGPSGCPEVGRAAPAAPASGKPAEPAGRYLDLLEEVDENDQGLAGVAWAPPSVSDPRLAEVIKQIARKEICDLDFPFVLAAPSIKGCPLVVCSAGFTGLTGYTAREVVGKPCSFLLCGVPRGLASSRACLEFQALLQAASKNEYYPGNDERGMAFLGTHIKDEDCSEFLPEGELAFVQLVATRSGEMSRCMFHFKQVELDDEMYLLGLQDMLPECNDANPEEHDRDVVAADKEERQQLAFCRLGKNMDAALGALASQFWFSAPMRRQTAVGDSDGD